MGNKEQPERSETSVNREDHRIESADVSPEPADAAAAGPETPAAPDEEVIDVDALMAAVDEANGRADDYWNTLLRTRAEMENLRKRCARELDQARKYAVERFATELLAVKDSLEMGVDAAGGETEAVKLREGTELTLKMLSRVMEKFNISGIDPQGQPFDAARHQAMTLQENSEVPPNTVVAVMQKGYALNERLLRPAMVIVSKAPEADAG
ncbi:MAG: nucleotide exchange factor GrpE [Gammaproteobacteria bacterium]|nr:nucleotide exchange factor GrpE [Gammaproteobacteria bacterium]MBA3731626.1 nucleotide exchange factor GrpE [Gammaproteobacteria bacterium]